MIYVSYDKYFSLGPFYETCIDASWAIQKIQWKITVDAQIGTRSQNIFISVKSQELAKFSHSKFPKIRDNFSALCA